MYTSTTFVAPNSCSQTRERSISRESARRAFCAMNTRSSYSRAVRSILLVSWFWSFTMRPTRARQTDSSLVLWLRQDREKARVVAPALEIGGARTVAGAAARLSGKPVSARPGLP